MTAIFSIGELKRNFNRIKSFFDVMTVKKLVNFIRINWQMYIGRSVLTAYPYQLFVDVTNVCNLNCKLCATGQRIDGYPKGYLSFDEYTKIIDSLYPYLFVVTLHNWGEPLLHKDIFKMIEYARKKNVQTVISTNLNVDKLFMQKLVDSKLTKVIVSIDGVDQESYSKYRASGNFHLVISNLKELVKIKKQKRSAYPFIEWQFLVFKHNEHLMNNVTKMAKDIGVDMLGFKMATLIDAPYMGHHDKKSENEWLPNNFKYRFDYNKGYLIDSRCDLLWTSFNVSALGTVRPCCWVYCENLSFGKNDFSKFMNIWNSPEFVESRKVVANELHIPDDFTPCIRCRVYNNRR